MRKNRATVLTLVGILLISNVVLLTILVSTNMSSEGDVAIGKAAPRGGPVNLPVLKGGAILPANQWPDACSFVDQEEIKAIFPGVKNIEQESRPINALSIKEFAADSSWKESDRSESGQCLYSMRLPGESYSATQFWFRIEAVADPKLIVSYVDRAALGTNTNQGARGADRCVITGLHEGSWNCRKGPLLFTVGGQTTVTFKGTPAPAPFVWRDDVLPEFVQTIAAKIK
ncbi:hypothetical protein [Streptomyces sp. NBC_01618]|uniref:hypothetical protein n=1 Tax=Streptomyces sp. NBC_01618 TaxID=2975900 RepID=UPI00386334FF|nr:hypothetical protein OH735_05040 [Streptomyces sp. NBC_01618]